MERVGHGVEQKQIDEAPTTGAAGTLVLAMRVKDRARADEVTRIMRGSGATEIRPITRANETLVSGISAASWTG